MSCRHQWAGAVIKGPVNHILVDQCEKCGKLRLQDAAPPAQGIDLGQLWEPIKEAVHTALSVHVSALSQKKREQVAVYVARQLRDGQRDAAPGVGNG